MCVMWSNPRYVEVWKSFFIYMAIFLRKLYNIGKTKFSSPRAQVVKAANHLKHSKSLVISPMWVQA